LNYGEVRFDVLQQFLEDSKSEWSHTGEPSLASLKFAMLETQPFPRPVLKTSTQILSLIGDTPLVESHSSTPVHVSFQT
jgi:hypothetical protein